MCVNAFRWKYRQYLHRKENSANCRHEETNVVQYVRMKRAMIVIQNTNLKFKISNNDELIEGAQVPNFEVDLQA